MTRNNTQAPEYAAAAKHALAHEATLHSPGECRTCKGKGRVRCPLLRGDCSSDEGDCPDNACIIIDGLRERRPVYYCTVPCPDCGGVK